MCLPLGGLNGGYIGLLLFDALEMFLSLGARSFSGVTTSGLVFDSFVLRGAVTGGGTAVFDDLGGLGIADSICFGPSAHFLVNETGASCFGDLISCDGSALFSFIRERE